MALADTNVAFRLWQGLLLLYILKN